jgi:hypothetical protein
MPHEIHELHEKTENRGWRMENGKARRHQSSSILHPPSSILSRLVWLVCFVGGG